MIGRLDFVKYAPCYLGSIITFYLKKRIRPRLPPWFFPLGLAFVVAVYLLIDRSDGGWLPCLALSLLIVGCRDMSWKAVNIVCHRIAQYSYGIYLGHAPIMWFACKAFKASAAARAELLIVLLVTVPVASYHLLEAPMLRLGSRIARRFSESPLQERRASAQAAG